jgi:hypothetical protein
VGVNHEKKKTVKLDGSREMGVVIQRRSNFSCSSNLACAFPVAVLRCHLFIFFRPWRAAQLFNFATGRSIKLLYDKLKASLARSPSLTNFS